METTKKEAVKEEIKEEKETDADKATRRERIDKTKESLKKAVMDAYGIEKRPEPPPLSEESLKLNQEVWDLAVKLIEKLESNKDHNNDLTVFLAIKCPGVGEPNEDGERADAFGFTSGKMLNLAHLINNVMKQHTELVSALVFDQKISSIMDIIDPDNASKSEAIEATEASAVRLLRSFMEGKRKPGDKPEVKKPEPEPED